MSVLQIFKKLSKKYIFEWTHFCELWIHSRKFNESKNSLLGGSQQFISSDFYMKSKILSMKRKSLKLWTHAKKMINLAIRKIKWSR